MAEIAVRHFSEREVVQRTLWEMKSGGKLGSGIFKKSKVDHLLADEKGMSLTQ